MKGVTRTSSLIASVVVSGCLLTAPAWAQAEWPPEQMTIVISHDVGSSQNQTTRALGEILAEKLGTTFVYDNRPGSSGRIGYDYFLGQPDDGSVLLSSNVGSAAIMYAQQKPDWNWEESLQPVGVFGIDPGLVFLSKDSEFKTFEDVIEAAKQRPLTLAISVWASPENLQVHQVMEATGAQFEIIPIGSSGELVTQVIGGHIDVGYDNVAAVERAGDLLSVVAMLVADNPVPEMTGDARPINEIIGAETMDIASYRGLLANKTWADANPDGFAKLQQAFAETVEDERFVAAMGQLGVPPGLVVNLSPEEISTRVIQRNWAAFEQFGHIYDQ